MSIDQFIDKLEADGGWMVGRLIRRQFTCRCPLEHVSGFIGWCTAGDKLHLAHEDTQAIMQAADGEYGFSVNLRARLLKACGLEEA